MSKRKFFRTVIEVVVLSEDTPIEYDSLYDVASAIDEGDCSGSVKLVEAKKISAVEAAKGLQEQGSDPEFFHLDENGNELED